MNFLQNIFLKRILSFFKKHRRIIFYIVVAAIVLPEVTVYFQNDRRGADIKGYLAAGHDALHLNNLYDNSAPGKNNTWPPFFSFFISPLALIQDIFGLPLTKELWYILNFSALIGAIHIISLLIYQKKPTFFKKSSFDFTSDRVFVPILLVLPALISNFFMLQINALILFLVIAGFYFNTRSKTVHAGFLLGLAAAIKAYPGLFLFYFLLKKQWKTAGFFFIFAAIFTLSPVIFYGFDSFFRLSFEWLTISFSKPLIVGYTTFNNHSLYAFWERLLAHQLHFTVPASLIHKICNLISILLLLLIVFANIFKSKARSPIMQAFDVSYISILMILFPPIAWGHYWLLLLPATFVIYYCLKEYPEHFNMSARVCFILYILLIQIPYFFAKTPVYYFLKSHSSNTVAALLLLASLLILSGKITRENTNHQSL